MNKNTLNILADAISEVGAWLSWLIKDDIVQAEFCDIMLYDESKPENDTHTTDVLAVRFRDHTFAVFLDDLDETDWPELLRNDHNVLYPVDTYELGFDDIKEAELLLNDYKNRIPIKDFSGPETLSAAEHLLYARCGNVGFIIGGDRIEVVGRNGKYSEEEIKTGSEKWWSYWKSYWKVRNTRDAYPKDYACEITIPVRDE